MLTDSIKRGYKIGSLIDFYNCKPQSKYIILRHDVDLPYTGVRELFSIEQSLGIRSSWYFRWSTASTSIIEILKKNNCDVGLHYETLANICLDEKIDNNKDVDKDIITRARDKLIEEINNFRVRFGVECHTIASHGHPLNVKIQISNNEIVTPLLKKQASLTLEAYDKEILDNIDTYISDCSLLLNNGWAYQKSLQNAIDNSNKIIYLLIHPHHWFNSPLDKALKFYGLITKGSKSQKKTFKSSYCNNLHG